MKVTGWTALGNGHYRVFGTQGPDGGFWADVSVFWFIGTDLDPAHWACNVLTCNNHAINAWELSGRCVEAICS
jgi:hypothetical protein